MAISKTKGEGVESYPYPVKAGQWYIKLNPGRLFVQQLPRKGKGSRGSFKLLYASAYNRGIQISHHKTKLHQIRQKQACVLN